MHTEATAPEKVPLGHRVQEEDISNEEYVPARQLIQSLSDETIETVVYFPGMQDVHLEAPAAVVNFPRSHDLHTEDKEAETVAENFPMSQDVQTFDASADEYDPVGHEAHQSRFVDAFITASSLGSVPKKPVEVPDPPAPTGQSIPSLVIAPALKNHLEA